MKTYIVLLRGINVSGKNKIPMQSLRDLLHDLNYKDVQTYIQSGNIILNSEEEKFTITEKINTAIFLKFGYKVPVLIRTIDEWEKVIASNPYSTDNYKALVFTFLNEIPKKTTIEISNINNDEYTIIKDVVYIYYRGDYGKTKLSNAFFEKKLNVIATSRNYKTTHKLLELAKEKYVR